MMSDDIREMSFQNVLDHVLKPAGVHVGGYPEEIFTDLNDEEKEKWICNICFLMVRDARECDNKHLFCHTCVFAWSLTYGENSQKCPMCRSHQQAYPANKEVDKLLKDKRVKCPEPSCSFRSPLGVFLMHSHGRQRFVNDQVDLESLRPTRRPNLGSQVIILPGGIAMPGGVVRAANIREQLQQGRAMIHQMMLLLHLEMQLRQQALVSYSQAQDPDTRLRRLDEVLSLNEQLNEVGTILSALLSTPLANRAAQPQVPGHAATGGETPAAPRRVDVSATVMMARGPTGVTSSPSPLREVLLSRGPTSNRPVPIRQLRATPPSPTVDEDDDDDDDSSDSETTSVSSVGSVVPRIRMSMNGQLNSPRDALSSTGGQLRTDLNRPLRRSEIRSQILSNTSGETSTSNTMQTNRLIRRDIPNSSSINSASTYNPSSSGLVSVQRLDSRGTVSTQRMDQNQGAADHGSSLPPLANSNSVTRQNGTPRLRNSGNGSIASSSQNGTAAGLSPNTSQTSGISGGAGLLPAGSSMHQRILQSINNASDDDNDEDSDDGPLDIDVSSIQRPDSVARRSLAPMDGGPRSLVVTSQGVTASGATFQTSADTPSTRAASRNVSTNAQPARTSTEAPQVTLSGAMVSVSAEAPETRTPTQVANSSVDTRGAAAVPRATPSEATRSYRTSTDRDAFNTITARSESRSSRLISVDDDVFVSDSANERPLSRSYAPQRRFRRDSNNLQSNPSVSRHSRSTTVPSSSQVPYVPHRTSVSPTRSVRNIRRTNSHTGDTEGRRQSFGRDDPNDSVVRMAARGGNTARNVLPQTPGQLLRSRRRGDPRRPDNGPGGTI